MSRIAAEIGVTASATAGGEKQSTIAPYELQTRKNTKTSESKDEIEHKVTDDVYWREKKGLRCRKKTASVQYSVSRFKEGRTKGYI